MKILSLLKNFTVYRRLCVVLGLCLLCCLSGLVNNTSSVGAAAGDIAYIRVIHASPDIGIVDVFVDGKKMLSAFQYATVTDYVPLAPGTHKVQLALIGKGVGAASVTQDLSVQAGKSYTVAALGTNQSGFSFTVFADDNTIMGTGSKVRIYHLSPGTGEAQVSTPTATIVHNLAYAHASSYIPLAQGAYTVSLTTGTQHATLSTKVMVAPWTVVSIFAIGLEQGSPHWRLLEVPQQGLPGMPQTGSDPHAPVASVPSPWPLALPVGLLVVVLAGCIIVLTRARPAYAHARPVKRPGREQAVSGAGSVKEG